MLSYKAEKKAKTLIQIDKLFSSSQLRSYVVAIPAKKPLCIRNFIAPDYNKTQ